MLVGHFAAALLAKRAEPRLSLGTTVVAATLADLLIFAFVIVGVEEIEIVRGRFGAANYFNAIDIGWSHSLAMGIAWAALFGAVHRWVTGATRASLIVAAAVLSHWFLDALSHPPHLPLAPAVAQRVGFGLWTSIPATLLVEGGLWVAALVLYLRATRSVTSAGRYVFWGGVIVLTLSWYNNIAGAAPSRPEDAATASLIFFLLWVGWGYWMNRARASTQPRVSSRLRASGADAEGRDAVTWDRRGRDATTRTPSA
jgi:hypothetical protein